VDSRVDVVSNNRWAAATKADAVARNKSTRHVPFSPRC
jgi:hypothetical protein